MVNNNLRNLRVVTGRIRFHYVNLFEPRETFEGSTPRYGMCLMISKGDCETLDNINRAIETAIQAGECIWSGKSLDNISVPLRDGDGERVDKTEFKGCYFLNATSKYMPEVVDENCFTITDPEEVYSGCYGRVAIRFFPYSKEGNIGVGCCLHNVQKLEEGEKLAVRISALEALWEGHSLEEEGPGIL